MAEHTLPRMRRPARPASPVRTDSTDHSAASFPLAAGLLLGLGVGGFFDGIVFHQLLQWHHMLSSAGYPPDSVENLKVNTLADGLFHASTYVFVLWGLAKLWRAARQPHFRWSPNWLIASMLMGFGLFNMVEGLVNHQLLGIHHVNETVPPEQWIYWDSAFFLWGLAMLVGGWLLLRRAQAAQAAQPAVQAVPGMLATGQVRPEAGQGVNLDSESVAGEEDPGASLDLSAGGNASSGAGGHGAGGSDDTAPVSRPPPTLNPGDEAAPGTPGTGEGLCRECGGSGRLAGTKCPACDGTGKVTVGVGGA